MTDTEENIVEAEVKAEEGSIVSAETSEADPTVEQDNSASVQDDSDKPEAEKEIDFPTLQANAKKLVEDCQKLSVNVVAFIKETAGLA